MQIFPLKKQVDKYVSRKNYCAWLASVKDLDGIFVYRPECVSEVLARRKGKHFVIDESTRDDGSVSRGVILSHTVTTVLRKSTVNRQFYIYRGLHVAKCARRIAATILRRNRE